MPVPRSSTFVLLLASCASSPSPAPELPAEMSELATRGTSPLPVVRPKLRLRSEWVPVAERVDVADGLDLAEAAAIALTHAPKILEARAEERIREVQLDVAGRPANPRLFLGPRWTEGGLEQLILPISLAFELVLNDRLDAERGRAKADLLAASHRVAAVETETLLEVRRGFVRVAALDERLRRLEGLAGTAETVSDALSRRVESRDVSPTEGRALLLEAEGLLSDRDALRAELEGARHDLLALVGLLPDAARLDPGRSDPFALPTPASAPATGSAGRQPTVLARAAELYAADEALRQARAAQVPAVQIGPEFESDDGDVSGGVGIGVDLPIFRSGSSEVDAAAAERGAARGRLHVALIEAETRARRRRSELDAAERALARHASRAAGPADDAASALRRRVDAGESGPLETALVLRAVWNAVERGVLVRERVALARIDVAEAEGLAVEAVVEDTNGDRK